MAKISNQIATGTRNPPIQILAHTVPKKAINITPEAVPRTSAFVTTFSVTLISPSFTKNTCRINQYPTVYFYAIYKHYFLVRHSVNVARFSSVEIKPLSWSAFRTPSGTFSHTIVTFVPSETASKRSEEHTSELQSRFDLVCR